MNATNTATTEQHLRHVQDSYTIVLAHAREKRDAAIMQAISEGWTQRQIAKATGLTPGRVAQISLGRR